MSKPDPNRPTNKDAGITQADLLHWIRSFVWSGEYDRDEVAILIDEHLGTGDVVDPAWLQRAIRREFAAKRKSEKAWPEVTDNDRLDRAFDALERGGVLALQMAGFTQSDGLEEVEDAYRDAVSEDPAYAGHCFYTEQDRGTTRRASRSAELCAPRWRARGWRWSGTGRSGGGCPSRGSAGSAADRCRGDPGSMRDAATVRG